MFMKLEFTGHKKQDAEELKYIEGLTPEQLNARLAEMEYEFAKEFADEGVISSHVKVELVERVRE